MKARRALVACALAVALPACDTRPGAALPPFPSDGTSGFGSASLVDVCIGSARAVPGASAAVCTPEGATPLACAADADCDAPERCQCGRCVVAACDPSTVCPSGEACRGGRCTLACTEDADCPDGGSCDGGGCTRACQADSACHRGEICNFFGVCAVEPCSLSAACGPGYTCEPLTLDADVREPEIARVADRDVMFFELRTAEGSAIYRGLLDDAGNVTADPTTPVLLPPQGHTRAGAPTALATGDSVILYAEIGDGASIGLATSTDGGQSFTWTNAAALVPSEPWENGHVGSPALLAHEGEILVFYEGGPGAGVGLAAPSGTSLERAASVPLLIPSDLEDASFWRSVQSIGTPFALAPSLLDASSTDTDAPPRAVRLYVTARGVEAGPASTPEGPDPTDPNDSIGLFATFDLDAFDRYPTGPVYTSTAGLHGSLGEREPAVRLREAGADLYFVATDATGASPAGLSRASTVR